MSNWDNNNVAHTNLWGLERWRLKKMDPYYGTIPFKDAGDAWSVGLLIGTLSAGESERFGDNKALAHATMLDEVFTDFFHAGYEPGHDKAKAIAIMEAILSDSSKKLKDLGDPVSDAYSFLGEAV